VLDDGAGHAVAVEDEIDGGRAKRHRYVALEDGGFEDPPQAGSRPHVRYRRELPVADVPSPREVWPRREHPAERADVDRFGAPAELPHEFRDVRQAASERLEDGLVGLAEAQGVEVRDGVGAVDLEQEAARVQAVPAALRGLLDHRDGGAGIVGSDCRAGARRPEPDDEDVDLGRSAHVGGSVTGRYGSEPSHPSLARLTVS
jgi:hypothetical protein